MVHQTVAPVLRTQGNPCDNKNNYRLFYFPGEARAIPAPSKSTKGLVSTRRSVEH